jgi:RNA polymerase sigma-70 factor (ECF subfamily)
MTRSEWSNAIESAYAAVYRSLVALGASPADAADALHDAVERALRRPEAETIAIERPEAWLFVVALRRWRTNRWRNRLFVPLDGLRAQPLVPAPGENAVALIAELKRLPQREREVFVSRYLLGLSQEETARALAIAVGTVAAATVHATRKLRKRLEATDERPRPETA